MAKHHAIKMIMIDQLPEEFANKLTKNMSYEQENLKPSPINK
jgi:hypothetical protein